jgi:hypothetical protein
MATFADDLIRRMWERRSRARPRPSINTASFIDIVISGDGAVAEVVSVAACAGSEPDGDVPHVRVLRDAEKCLAPGVQQPVPAVPFAVDLRRPGRPNRPLGSLFRSPRRHARLASCS